MNKVYFLGPKENWICDRFAKEWNEDNIDISVPSPVMADVIWLNASWCWEGLFKAGLLDNKKIITTVHHIVPEKWNMMAQCEFVMRDQITTVYHVYNQHTLDFIRPFTKKMIHLLPYWANSRIWCPTTIDHINDVITIKPTKQILKYDE